MPIELRREAKRKPEVKGATYAEIAGRLIQQQHGTRAALRRSIGLYEDCRRT